MPVRQRGVIENLLRSFSSEISGRQRSRIDGAVQVLAVLDKQIRVPSRFAGKILPPAEDFERIISTHRAREIGCGGKEVHVRMITKFIIMAIREAATIPSVLEQDGSAEDLPLGKLDRLYNLKKFRKLPLRQLRKTCVMPLRENETVADRNWPKTHQDHEIGSSERDPFGLWQRTEPA